MLTYLHMGNDNAIIIKNEAEWARTFIRLQSENWKPTKTVREPGKNTYEFQRDGQITSVTFYNPGLKIK